MIDFFVQLEARAPERNIWRSYCIAAGQDIFGDWIVELTYGRIGAKGHTKTIMLPDEAETRRYVRHCLKRREGAPKPLAWATPSKTVGALCSTTQTLSRMPKPPLIVSVIP